MLPVVARNRRVPDIKLPSAVVNWPPRDSIEVALISTALPSLQNQASLLKKVTSRVLLTLRLKPVFLSDWTGERQVTVVST